MVDEAKKANRAVLFVDGSNFYHGLKKASATGLGHLDFAKVALKLVGPRTWVELRYYVGQVSQSGNTALYAHQRAFVDRQKKLDSRISFHFGRLETRSSESDAAKELLEYLAGLKTKIDAAVYKELVELGKRHKRTATVVEKAVDVMLAVDLVVLAERDVYDTAYILSADGDYTPAVKHVRERMKKKVFGVAASNGHQLASAVDSFIGIDASWVSDCYITPPSIRHR